VHDCEVEDEVDDMLEFIWCCPNENCKVPVAMGAPRSCTCRRSSADDAMIIPITLIPVTLNAGEDQSAGIF
jgi:hypothetical protein